MKTKIWSGLLVFVLFGCADESAVSVGPPSRIVLVTLDTLRADHMSAYGHPIQTTPFIDSLAENGALFRRAFSHSATTKPSHVSIFTSLYVMQHGVEQNGVVLDRSFRTLAEMLSGQGFRTAAFVSIDVPLGGNLDQGFETWDQFQPPPSQRHLGLYRPARETVDAARTWLETVDSSEKVFLWLHVYDPHRPMSPPREHLDRINRMIEEIGPEEYSALLEERGIPSKPEIQAEIVEYDAEILYVDTEIELLFRDMQEAGLGEDAIWIITGDHGQGLGAHEWFGHSKQIYNAQLHVPLMIWRSGNQQPVEVNEIVEHVDLLPTIADLTGATLAQIMPIQGRSLVPYLDGGHRPDPKQYAFAERSRYAEATERQRKRGNYEPGSRYALQDSRFKYQLFTEGEDEFYDLEVDPYEMNNLIDAREFADDREPMLEVLLDLIQTLPRGPEAQAVSPEEVERLRALGYIQ
jgi:arylsulfatase A-like enzyme